jgi:RNA polymerase sigma-70 factor (ECF subfamily)
MIGFGKTSDRDLMRRFRAGDRDAFTAIYRTHSGPIHRFALRMIADPAKAAEITQDVFVWLIHHPDSFDPERGELGAFLTGVARKHLQRRWQQDRRWVPFDDITPPVAPLPESDDGDETDRLRGAIAALPAKYREVVVLCDLEERSYEDAAAALDCATGTIRSRLHRARSLLSRKLLGAPREARSMRSSV